MKIKNPNLYMLCRYSELDFHHHPNVPVVDVVLHTIIMLLVRLVKEVTDVQGVLTEI